MAVDSCDPCLCPAQWKGQEATNQASLIILCGILEAVTGGGGVAENVNIASYGGTATTLGQKAMAASIPVVVASDQSNLPTNLAQVGGAAIALGQGLMAASVPVVLASNQTNVPTNIAQVGGAAVALGQAAMAASVPVVISSNQTNLPTNLAQVGGAAVALGQAAMAASIPVVLASNQTNVGVNLTQIGGAAYALGSAVAASSAPIVIASNQTWTGATNIAKIEDDAHVSGDVGIEILAVRQDTLAALAGNGDYIPLTTDSSGRLRTIVSGPIDQGNSVSSSPPILNGLMAATSNPGSISNGQMVRSLADLIGRQVVALHGLPENTWTAVSASDITDTSSTQIKAATASTRHYISSVGVSNMDATVATRVDILDGSTVVWTGPAAALGGGYMQTFPQQIRGTSNTAINAQCGTTSAEVRVALGGTSSAQ